MKKILLGLVCLALAGHQAQAQKSETFSTKEGAIHGYDPVAYFRQGKAVKGDTAISYQWREAKWYFSSRQNLDSFAASPERYAPQYGGYCAYGMAGRHKAPTEPEAFLILNDKLYLNYNKNVQSLWKQKPLEYIQIADTNWQAIKNKE